MRTRGRPVRSGLSGRAMLAIGAVAVLGAAMRLSALFPLGGPARFPFGYDEGVYSSAASLFARGVLPYQDFAFVHPPGILYLLAPLGLMDPSEAFTVGRVVSALVGGVNVAVIGALAARRWGVLSGVVGGVCYAFFPEVVHAEHGVFLEPWLNLCSLLAIACWLSVDDATGVARRRFAIAAGVLAGVAFTVKLWAILPIAAMALVPPRRDRGPSYRSALSALVVTGLVLWTPMLVGGPLEMIGGIVGFQLDRPPDGAALLTERLELIFLDPLPGESRHLPATIAALAGVAVALTTLRSDRLARIALWWFGATVGSFLLSSTYWDQYNAALAPSMSLLAAAGASAIGPAWRRPGRARTLARGASCLLVLLCIGAVARTVRETRERTDALSVIAADLASAVPAGECVVSFEPIWLVGADRLPVTGADAVLGVDPYAAHTARIELQTGGDQTSGTTAFSTQALDEPMLRSFGVCPYLLLGWRGHYQLTPEQQAWIGQRYRPIPHRGPADLWQRLD